MQARVLNYLFVSGLGLVALASSAYVGLGAWTRLHEISEGRELVEVLSPTVKFVDQLARERGAYNAALSSWPNSHASALAAIDASKKETDALFSATLSAARSLPADLSANVAAPIAQARNDIEDARSELAAHLAADAVSAPEEIRRLIGRYFSAGAEIDRALAATERRLSALDPALGLKLEVSRLANDIREDASQRSMLLAHYISGRAPLTADERKLLLRQDGEIEEGWRRLQRIAGDVGGFKVAASVRRMKAEFFDAGGPIYEAAVDAALTGAAPPMALEEWGSWTVARLTETLGPRDAAIAEVRETLDAMQAESIRNASIGLVVVLGLLIIFLVIGLYLQRRVTRPISILARAIDPNTVQDDDAGVVAAVAANFAERDDEIGALARAVVRMRDRTDDLQVANDRFDALVDNLPHGVCLYDSHDFLWVANRKFGEIYGFPDVEALIGLKFSTVYEIGAILNDSASRLDAERFLEGHSSRAQRNGQVAGKIIELPSGRVVSINGCRVPGGGWISTHIDVTEQRRAEQQIAFIAEHDPLTGLANRALFSRRLDLAFQRADRGAKFAVMCLDLDRFKLVNDLLGHGPGDELLRQVGRRLQSCIRDLDCAARIGGDEFAVLLEDPTDGLAEIAERIIARLSEPYKLDGQHAEVSASVGVAVGMVDAETPEELERAADLAMYCAKNSGRGVFRFFEPAMDEQVRKRRALEHDMRGALAGGQFELRYHPIYNVKAGEIVAFEALLRWNHPRRGYISPIEFLPLAEDCGLIVEIGAWVVRRACEDAIRWPKKIRIAVNLSQRQFSSGRLVADIVGALAETGLAPRRLELEITERVMLDSAAATLAALHELRSLGVSIALDDFGAGYSSLSYLRRFPFDRIKIDRAFVRDMTRDDSTMAIVRAVTGLAKALNMRITAEGVETSEQFAILIAEGCTELQGFLLGRPVWAAEVSAVLAAAALPAQVA